MREETLNTIVTELAGDKEDLRTVLDHIVDLGRRQIYKWPDGRRQEVSARLVKCINRLCGTRLTLDQLNNQCDLAETEITRVRGKAELIRSRNVVA